MMINASPEDQTVVYRGEPVKVRRGQLVMSEATLSKELNWSRGKLRRFLNERQENKTISARKQYSRFTLLTLLKYDTYLIEQSTGSTVKKPPKPKQEKLFDHAPIDIELTELLVNSILENNPKARCKNMTKDQQSRWIEECRKMRALDERSPFEIREIIQFSQRDKFEKTVVLSMSKLRGRFDSLWVKSGQGKGKNKYSGYADFGKEGE